MYNFFIDDFGIRDICFNKKITVSSYLYINNLHTHYILSMQEKSTIYLSTATIVVIWAKYPYNSYNNNYYPYGITRAKPWVVVATWCAAGITRCRTFAHVLSLLWFYKLSTAAGVFTATVIIIDKEQYHKNNKP